MKKIIALLLAMITLASAFVLSAAAVSKGTELFTSGYNNEYKQSVLAGDPTGKARLDASVWDQAPWYKLPYKESNFSDNDLNARMKSVVVLTDDGYMAYCFLVEVNQAERNNIWYDYKANTLANKYAPLKVYPDNYGDQDCVEIFFEETPKCENPTLGTNHSHKQVRFNVGNVLSPVNPNAQLGDKYQNLETCLGGNGNRFKVVKTTTGYRYYILMASYMSQADEFLDYIDDDYPLAVDVLVKAVKKDGTVLKLHSSVDVANGETAPNESSKNYGTILYNLDTEYTYKAGYVSNELTGESAADTTSSAGTGSSNTTGGNGTAGNGGASGNGTTGGTNGSSSTGDVSSMIIALLVVSFAASVVVAKKIRSTSK